MDQMEKLGAKTGSSLGHSLDTATEHVRAAATETGALAAEKLSSLADSARHLGEEGVAAVTKTVERNPITAIAIAAGAGLIAGMMCRRTGS